jgi:hypothetical protein
MSGVANGDSKVNTSKTNVIQFRPSRTKKSDYEFTYGDIVLESVKEYKYLGVIMDEHLSFNSCCKTLGESCGRALSVLLYLNLKCLGTFTKMFEACVSYLVMQLFT